MHDGDNVVRSWNTTGAISVWNAEESSLLATASVFLPVTSPYMPLGKVISDKYNGTILKAPECPGNRMPPLVRS